MATPIQTYSVLLVSAARKINTALMSFLPGERFDPVTVVDTAARARRTMAERDYDFIIINGPLPDEFGRKLAIDLSGESGRVVLLLVRSDVYEEICIAMTPHGVLVARRPMDTAMLGQLLNIMCSVRDGGRRAPLHSEAGDGPVHRQAGRREEYIKDLRLTEGKWLSTYL